MTEDQNTHGAVLRELSDIKSSLAVNTNETKHIKDGVEEIKTEVKEVKQKVEFQNGRVRTLEDWTKDAQKIIENTSKVANGISLDYKVNKTRIWTAILVIIFLGGAIITLAILAIDNKIKEGISQALEDNISEIKYAE